MHSESQEQNFLRNLLRIISICVMLEKDDRPQGFLKMGQISRRQKAAMRVAKLFRNGFRLFLIIFTEQSTKER